MIAKKKIKNSEIHICSTSLVTLNVKKNLIVRRHFSLINSNEACRGAQIKSSTKKKYYMLLLFDL